MAELHSLSLWAVVVSVVGAMLESRHLFLGSVLLPLLSLDSRGATC